MSLNQRRNFALFKELIRQLKAYGLNPYDWQISRETLNSANRIEMVHRQDRNFRFRGHFGQLDGGRPYWLGLQLISI